MLVGCRAGDKHRDGEYDGAGQQEEHGLVGLEIACAQIGDVFHCHLHQDGG